jgi:hypothetical protein
MDTLSYWHCFKERLASDPRLMTERSTNFADPSFKLNAGLLVETRSLNGFAVKAAVAIKATLAVHHPTRPRDFATGK